MSWSGRFPVTYGDCEDAAEHVLRIFGLNALDRVDCHALAGVMGAQVHPGAPRGCKGIGLLDAPIKLFDDGAPDTLAHELQHLALEIFGVPPAHQPDRLVTLGSGALEMPRMGMRRALGDVGLSAWHLMGRYVGITPSRVFVRAAMVAGGVAVFYRGRSSPTRCHAEGIEPPDVLPGERELVETVRRRGGPVVRDGIGAWPCSDDPDGRGYVVVLAEPRAAWTQQARTRTK